MKQRTHKMLMVMMLTRKPSKSKLMTRMTKRKTWKTSKMMHRCLRTKKRRIKVKKL